MKLEKVKFITSDIKESPKFFKNFDVKGKVKSAQLTITGLGLYNAFINGSKAGDSYLAPGFNDYDNYLRYEEIDVTDLINEGSNKIEVYLGNGWYKGRFGLMPRFDLSEREYILAASLEIKMAAGTVIVIESDESWSAEESVIRSNSIYDGEVRDDTFKASETINCRIADAKYNLEKSLVPPIREKHVLKPELIRTKSGENVLDFKQNMAGVIRFINSFPKGTTISLKFGEILIDGNFYNENYRSANGGFVYISDGRKKTVEAMFTYFGFRYVKVEIAGMSDEEAVKLIDPEDFTALVLYSDLKNTIRVKTSNEKVNRLLQNSVWGQRSNFLDVPTDCPQRDERLGWTGDAQAFAYTACFNMNCEAFYKKYIRDMRYDQQKFLNGDIPMFSPCLGDAAPGGPAWADAAAIIPWTVYEHYGNVDDLKEAYPMMRDYTETLIKKDNESAKDHLIKVGHCFGDWLALDGATKNSFKGGTEDDYCRAFYYWYSVTLTARAAEVIGEEEDAEKYFHLADDIKAAFIAEFITPNGRLCIDTQTGYVLALCFGLYRDKEKLIKGFKRRLAEDQLKLKTGFVGTSFLLRTLFENGMEDYAYRMMLTEEFPGWLYAVNLGATTIWERWNSVMPDGSMSPTGMNSLNHYSYGAVAGAYYSYVAGLRMASPGWKKAVISPIPNYRLKGIDLEFNSPAGTYKSAWEIRADGQFCMKVTVPEGASAKIVLPYHPEGSGDHGHGLAIDAAAGEYEYTYKPTVDFIHPYNGDTFIADIVADPNAVRALTEAIPGQFDEALTSSYADNSSTNLAGAIFFTPIADLPKKIDEILKDVEAL